MVLAEACVFGREEHELVPRGVDAVRKERIRSARVAVGDDEVLLHLGEKALGLLAGRNDLLL
jgi:hypothetical protein